MKTNERLKHFLAERGFKQSAVARGIGMNQKTFNAVLNGHADLKADTLEKVCNFTGTTPGIFFEYEVQSNGISEAPA